MAAGDDEAKGGLLDKQPDDPESDEDNDRAPPTKNGKKANGIKSPKRVEIVCAEMESAVSVPETSDQVAMEMETVTHAPMASEIGAPKVQSALDGTDSDDEKVDKCTDELHAEIQAIDAERGRAKRLVRPFSCSNAALTLHYLTAGFVSAVCSAVLYGVLMGVMSVQAHVYLTSQTVVAAPWGVKAMVGFVSDHFPIAGSRRKYYCIAGLCISALASLGLATLFHEPVPYHCFGGNKGDAGYDDTSVCNEGADASAHVVVLGLMGVMTGIVVSDAAADGMMIESAQAQPRTLDRVRVPITAFILRATGAAVGALYVGIGFNGPTHLGFFASDVGLNYVMATICGLTTIGILFWVFLSAAEAVHSVHIACCHCCSGAYPEWNSGYAQTRCDTACGSLTALADSFSTRGAFMFLVYNLVVPALITASTSPAEAMVQRYWVHVENMQLQVSTLIVSIIYLVGLVLLRCVARSIAWRPLIALATVFSATICLAVGLLTTFDLGLRNQYFYLTQTVLDALPAGTLYFVCTLVVVELAPQGQEATLYGIVTTAHAAAVPAARAVANGLYGTLPVLTGTGEYAAYSNKNNYLDDAPNFRASVGLSLVTAFGMLITSLFFLGLLPADAASAMRIKIAPLHEHRTCYGVMSLLLLVLFYFAGVGISVVTLIPNLRCAQWLGGKGCSV